MSGSSSTLQFCFPTHGDAILCKMQALREERRFCDVTLVLGALQGPATQLHYFHGHRVVLAASSDFLRDQFLLHEGQSQLSVHVVPSVEIGKRLLLSCYTGLLEVPLRELVSYLTTASALQMSQVVEKCAQAVSQYLSPTLAFLKVENPLSSDEKRRKSNQKHSESSAICCKEEEDSDAAQPSTSSLDGGAEGLQLHLRLSKGTKEGSRDVWEVTEDRKVVRSSLDLSEDGLCLLDTLESEEDGGIQPTNNPTYRVQPDTDTHKHKPRPSTTFQNHISSTRRSPALHAELVDSSQNQDEEERERSRDDEEMCDLAARLQDVGESTDSRLLCQRPYLCRRCDRIFQHLESYVSHLKEHRQYLCLVCGKSFSQKSNLTRHIRVHTGVKPFLCPLCHKTFSQKASLQDHLNLHTGDKPHKCNYCAVHFAHKPGLRRHLREIHGKTSLQNVLEETVD
ncbi:zinc finger and BTB domain-containing protein 26-like [Thalassophryne amazonica]|uniref:zinc finger and BTB domain-containing protein 26-like n=1 Tax=Thalassophryne amazonica TaxID=390379 RepID=UPI0014712AC2|nr:zinc finger and BTB domain-containing protein 26-like [Thalassophryne amazonica]